GRASAATTASTPSCRASSTRIMAVRAERRPRRLGGARREASLQTVVVRAERRPRRLGGARREASLQTVVVRAGRRPRRLGGARREASLQTVVVRAVGRRGAAVRAAAARRGESVIGAPPSEASR